MRYREIRHQLKTGDLLLFSGKGGISGIIRLFTLSRWSHVGMVCRDDDPPEARGTVFCWESTSLGDAIDADTGRPIQGVQSARLSRRLRQCLADGGRIAVRQLSRSLTDPMIHKLNVFRREVRGRPYEQNNIELLKSAYDGPRGENREDTGSLFCSELIAEAYQRMGLLPETPPSNEYTPKDFSTERSLQLNAGYELAEEILVESPE